MDEPARHGDDASVSAARSRIDAATDAWQQALDAVEAMTDSDQAWELATELSTTVVPAFRASAAQLRARVASRIHQEQRLSLAELGQKLRVTKGTAQEYIDTARGRSRTRKGSGEAA